MSTEGTKPAGEVARAVRNNNPGNIERNAISWLGLAADQSSDDRFCVFVAPKYGFRALALDLHTKWHNGLTTARQIIAKYAPPNENDTGAYVKAVAEGVGLSPDAALDLNDPLQLAAMCRAIAVHESGSWFFDRGDLDLGVALALDRNRSAIA